MPQLRSLATPFPILWRSVFINAPSVSFPFSFPSSSNIYSLSNPQWESAFPSTLVRPVFRSAMPAGNFTAWSMAFRFPFSHLFLLFNSFASIAVSFVHLRFGWLSKNGLYVCQWWDLGFSTVSLSAFPRSGVLLSPNRCISVFYSRIYQRAFVLSRSTTFRFDINFLEPHFELLSRSLRVLRDFLFFFLFLNIRMCLGF